MAGCLPSFKKKRKPDPAADEKKEEKEEFKSDRVENADAGAQPKNEGEETKESSDRREASVKTLSNENESDKERAEKESDEESVSAKSDSETEKEESQDERADSDASSDTDVERREPEAMKAVKKRESKRAESKATLREVVSRSDTSVSAASYASQKSKSSTLQEAGTTSESALSHRSAQASVHADPNELKQRIEVLTKERDEAVQLHQSVSAELEQARKTNASLVQELDQEKQKVQDLESALAAATAAATSATNLDPETENLSTMDSAAVPREAETDENGEIEKSTPPAAVAGSFSRHSSKAAAHNLLPEFEPVETFTRSFSPAPVADTAVPTAEERQEAEEELKKVTAERDALAKQLESAADFYTSHIQRVTDIYNRVVARAQAAERKKNKYAEKLAELMMTQGADDEEVRNLQPPRPLSADRSELEALRVQKQELEDRVGALIDRCYLLQQELANAQKCSAVPQSEPLSRRSTLPSQQEPSRQSTLFLSRKSSALTAQTVAHLEQRLPSATSTDPQLLSQAAEREPTHRAELLPRDSMYEYPRLLFEREDEMLDGSASPGSKEETMSMSSRLGTLRLDFGDKEEERAPLRQATSRVTFSVLSGQGGRPSPRESLISLSSDMFAEPESGSVYKERSLRTIPEEGGKPEAEITPKQSMMSLPPDMFAEPESKPASRVTSLRSIPEEGTKPEAEITPKQSMMSLPPEVFPELESKPTSRAASLRARAEEGEKRAVDLRALERTLSEKGIESFLTQEDTDEDNSVLSSFSRRSGLESHSFGRTPTRTFPSDGAPVLVTAQCCGKSVKKSDLRNMENCGCSVCRKCLKVALISSKEDIRNFMGTDPVSGSPQWKIRCPRCTRPQIVSPKTSHRRSFPA
ncbi:hypothetical protein TGGT1_221390 [Toxoplasma gondii GT1]|nr:hypothetical protein TGGT1_221390 [Toxoplasma gondii GT1]KFG47367.1 hypothetical protein TGFOU_221390 [Toxoplasma gondii FOU]